MQYNNIELVFFWIFIKFLCAQDVKTVKNRTNKISILAGVRNVLKLVLSFICKR